MKSFVAFLLLIAVSACNSPEKTVKDPAVIAFIRKPGIYIPMTDEAKLKQSLEKSTKSIFEFMAENDMNRSDYYLIDGEFRVSTDTKYILIPIRHYNSIAKDYKSGRNMDEIIRKKQLTEQANSDETDGFLLLDIKSDKVDGFQPW